jgi:hypothetical protein
LQPLQILVFPIHQNVCVLGPALDSCPVRRFFTKTDLVQDVRIQHIVISDIDVLAEQLRVVIENFLKRLTFVSDFS